jgi:hypothetical protein
MESFGDRLVKAMGLSKVTIAQVSKASGLAASKITAGIEAEWVAHRDALALATVLEVDCRWLVLGIVPPAYDEACSMVRRSGLDELAQERLLRLFKLMPTPGENAGVCRYCGRTEAELTTKCAWVDLPRTLCADCLEPEEESDAGK